MTDLGTGPDRPGGRLAIFLLTVGVLLVEIAATRIFSFSLWYHFTYVAISVALLGFGASGTLLATSSRLARMPADRLFAQSMLLSAAGAIVLLLAIAFIRVEPFSIAKDPTQLLRLVLVFLLCSAPFLASGMALAVAFRETTSPNGVYFADLLGAGAGCALAVGAIWTLGSPGTVAAGAALFVAAAVIAAPPSSRRSYLAAGSMLVAGATAVAICVPLYPSPEKLLAGMMASGVVPSYSRWSPIFRVDVYPEPVAGKSGSRAVSPKFPPPSLPVKYISHDGYAEAPMYRFSGDDRELDFLAHSLSASPYQVSRQPSVLVIGLGGGYDVLNARRNGAGKVKGIELDPLTVDIVKNVEADFNGRILQAPNVDVVAAEGRSFLRHSPESWDLIQMTEVDTLAASSSGAYMLAESYLNTRESVTEYLQHLTPGGTLSILMLDLPWKTERARFSLRHLMNFIGATESLGIDKASDHAAILALPPYIEMMMKREPWTAADIDTLQKFADREGFDVLHLPGKSAYDNPYSKLLHASPAEREEFLDRYPLNVRATTDDRPFFFHHYRWLDLLSRKNWEFDGGIVLATGQIVLAAILLISVLSAGLLILGPLLWKSDLRVLHAGRFGLYFAALGLGFMFIEISLIQRFILFLGHPTYSVAVILFALLAWTGLGAYASGRVDAEPKSIIGAAFIALVVLIGFYAWLVPVFFASWLGAPAFLRYASTVALLFPLGLVLGVFFPTGLVLVREHDELLVPWAWGANGAASVVGSILAIVLALSVGFQGVLYAAALVYLGGIVALFGVRKAVQ